MMRGYIANTHHDWFDFLARRPSWDEVNFWNPSDYYAFRGQPGSPFFFRLKSPRSAIGGFGIVARFDKLPEWLAWECFEQGNGAATITDFQDRLRDLRKTNRIEVRDDLPRIGCIILSAAHFFSEDTWVRQPVDWGRQNLRYKGYDLTSGEGLRVWQECQERVRSLLGEQPLLPGTRETTERFGTPSLVHPRLGQGAFRLAVTAAYRGACAVTGEHSLPALEASHIKPYGQGGEHVVSNGLLLRSDLHRLFDRGYITVTPSLRVEVSRRLRVDYENGRTYYPMQGQRLKVPRAQMEMPAAQYLEWHNQNVYRSA